MNRNRRAASRFTYTITLSDESGQLTTWPRVADVTTGEHHDLADGLAGGSGMRLLFTFDGQWVFSHKYGWYGKSYCGCLTVLLPVDGGEPQDVAIYDELIGRSPNGDEYLGNMILTGMESGHANVFTLDGRSRQVEVGRHVAVSW